MNLSLPTVFCDHMSQETLCLYGYGFLGAWVFEFFKREFQYTLPIYDKDPKVTSHGLARPLSDLRDYQGIVILCCRHHIRQVSSTLDKMNVRWVSADRLFLQLLEPKRERILDAFSHDNFSVKTYLAIEKILKTGSMCEHEHLVSNQYFEPPEFRPTFADHFIDAGAFCGDTLDRFVTENLGTFGHYYGFEPGSRQFSALSFRTERLVKEWSLDTTKLTLLKLGLGASESRMVFNESSSDSMSHSFGTQRGRDDGIQVVSLDGFLEGREVTFLKSDIEGMDVDFLLGAKDSITANRPRMALSCYHYPTDLSRMIEIISELSMDYKFKIRHHANVIGDYVLYVY